MKAEFRVSIDLPIGATKADMREYIREAIGFWCGSFHPDSPLFGIDPSKVRVSQIRKDSHCAQKATRSPAK